MATPLILDYKSRKQVRADPRAARALRSSLPEHDDWANQGLPGANQPQRDIHCSSSR